MTSLMGTSIITARSLAVTNSVSFSTRLSAASASAASRSREWKASRFSLRHFTPFFWPLSLLIRRARVSFTCFCTSSSDAGACCGALRRLRSLPFALSRLRPLALLLLPPLLPPRELLLPPRFCPGCCWLDVFSMSTFSLPMRLRRFLPCPAAAFAPVPVAPAPAAFALRSLRRSSFVFRRGRVDWLIAERSIFPITLSWGAG